MKKLLLIPSFLMALPLFSQNIITNPSLEEWTEEYYFGKWEYYPTTWMKTDAIQSSDNPKDGNYCAELKTGKYIRFRNLSGIEANATYVLTFYIHDTNPNRNIRSRLTWLNNSGISLNSEDNVHEQNQAGWIKIEKEITAPNDAVGFNLNINTDGDINADVSNSMKVDLFSFEKKENMGTHEISAKEAKIFVQHKVLHITTTQKSTLKIINLNGQTLKTETVSGNTEVNVGALPKGVYVVVLESAKGIFSKKVMF